MSTCSNLLSVFGGGDWTTTFPFDLVHTRQECDKKREQDYSFFITETCKGENIGIHSYEHTSKIIDTGNNDSTSIEELEVLNIYKAINHLENILKLNKGEKIILMDVETMILETHKILMKGILPKGKNGSFSTCVRFAVNKNNEQHYYPVFETEKEAFNSIQNLVDYYNEIVAHTNDQIKIIKACAYFMYNFLTLHPFNDGNGRTARLLYSFLLKGNGIVPHFSPITHPRDQFVDTLVYFREHGDGRPLLYVLLESIKNK
nr:MAG: hypothetical protein [White spot syndrome virus]BDX27760.1 MAG: hypothetical protein [White spot syndrome virus]BDX27920.1 MAG: hypothetical protein [White spot syndrome virus]BDX28082.1 MAG: hypothetical protein [White spot syndrome virus]